MQMPSSSRSHRAISGNLLSEHRVSESRFHSFAAHVIAAPDNSIDLSAIESAVTAYQRQRVTVPRSAQPAYEASDNDNNRIAPDPSRELCSVIDLTRTAGVYEEARLEGLDGFARFDASPGDRAAVNLFLQDEFAARGAPFIGDVFRALRWYRLARRNVLYPFWAADWKSIAAYLNPPSPNRWLDAVGVAKDAPVFLAVVRYRLPDDVALYRPTQLDAGWYVYHFPSPPGPLPVAGGFTMDLHAASAPGQQLVEEYVHREIDFAVGDWLGAGELAGLATAFAAANNLDTLRSRHWDRLSEKYAPLDSWMKKP